MTPAEVGTRLLLALAVVLVATRLVGWVARRVGQPQVMGEIVAGIILGPSLLGLLWPDVEAYLFPDPVVDGLRAIAQVGLILFMFLVGVGLDVGHLRGQGHRAVVISHTSIIAPLVLGAALAVWLHPRLGGEVPLTSFALFLGVAMAITAFPVLVRILQESGLHRTRIGALTLTCAAVDDVTAWCLLAVVVALVGSSGALDVAVTIGASALFVAVVLWGVRPLLERRKDLGVPMAVAFAFVCAWITEVIGIHAIFGAFLAGVVMPRSVVTRGALTTQLETAATVVLLPVFFAVVGLSTQLGLLDDLYLWGIAALVLATAVAGKLGGASLAARSLGESWRDAGTIGVLMNTRGLTELVILTVGLELGVISDTMFTIMVIMALVTTLMAAPALRLLGVAAPGSADDAPARPTAGPARRGGDADG
jgi:Kef-type K+ transport system membrane component KefB